MSAFVPDPACAIRIPLRRGQAGRVRVRSRLCLGPAIALSYLQSLYRRCMTYYLAQQKYVLASDQEEAPLYIGV